MICQSTLLWKIIKYHAKTAKNEENHSSTGLLRTHFIKALPNSSASVTHVFYTQLKNSIPVCNHWFRSVRKIDYLFYTLNYSTLKLKDELVGNWPIFKSTRPIYGSSRRLIGPSFMLIEIWFAKWPIRSNLSSIEPHQYSS